MTAVETLLKMLEDQGADITPEIRTYFLTWEREQIEQAVIYGLDEDGHTGDWKINVARNYYEKKYKNQ
jgi:hypothetical protein